MNGIITKVNEVFAEVSAADFDVYMFTETRLNDSINSNNLFPPNDFDIYRCDRSMNTSNKKSGGGVLISVHKKYNSDLIITGEPYGCEQLWCIIKNKEKKIFLGVLYIPPNSTEIIYEKHMSLAKNVCEKADNQTTIVLYGDFNLPLLQWTQSEIIESTYFPVNITYEENTIDSCNDNGLFQINSVLNDNNRILDLVWTNEPNFCVCQICDDNILHNEKHHKALEIQIDFETNTYNSIEQYKDYANADYNSINNEIMLINWDLVLNNNNESLQMKTDNFTE